MKISKIKWIKIYWEHHYAYVELEEKPIAYIRKDTEGNFNLDLYEIGGSFTFKSLSSAKRKVRQHCSYLMKILIEKEINE